ncbi:hypothetical protein F5Y18DRAFT_46987 [Xylariaceae sp. FL1019]|nr:hypothetical protein F5Y18DRAFT_46987 [Xylariaceae sp. FL1019]
MEDLQRYVMRDGRYVLENVSAQQLLETKAHGTSQGFAPLEPEPTYGLLTKTVIESPVICWALPAQLRSASLNDIALVSERSVQICEVCPDYQLRNVVTKRDFGSKIQNCLVMGDHAYLERAEEKLRASLVRREHDDIDMPDATLPEDPSFVQDGDTIQQLLVLVLEDGDMVFLGCVPTGVGGWRFLSYSENLENIENPEDLNLENPRGPTPSAKLIDLRVHHMAISPSWDYLTLACGDFLLLAKLRPMKEIQRRFHEDQQFDDLILEMRAQSVKGSIHQTAFLHPGIDKRSQIVLLTIVVKQGVSKLVIVEWDTADPLQAIFGGDDFQGYRLEEDFKLPLLVIPLKVECQFLFVTEDKIVIGSDVLSGPPNFMSFALAVREDTGRYRGYHGSHAPLWTAWTRPMRKNEFFNGFSDMGRTYAPKDAVYLAREDGWIFFIEIAAGATIGAAVSMGPVSCDIDTAFTSVGIGVIPIDGRTKNFTGDLILACGRTGPGAICMVEARKCLEEVGPLLSWSPTVDFAVTGDVSSTQQAPADKVNAQQETPEKVYMCSGTGASGSILEMRYGIQAKIGLDLEYPSPIRHGWVISKYEAIPDDGFWILLALPEHSTLLEISHDFSEVSEKDTHTTGFDMSSVTLAVHVATDFVVQVTTTGITVVSSHNTGRHSIQEVTNAPLSTVANAAISDNIIALAMFSSSESAIAVVCLSPDGLSLKRSIPVEGEITCLCLCRVSGGLFILAGIWKDNCSRLVVYTIEAEQPYLLLDEGRSLEIEKAHGDQYLSNENGNGTCGPLTSIISTHTDYDKQLFVIGTRNGDVLTVQTDLTSRVLDCEVDRHRFGVATSQVFTGPSDRDATTVLVCNDAGLAAMRGFDRQRRCRLYENAFRVWFTDAKRQNMASPLINSVVAMDQSTNQRDPISIMIAGSRILVTEMQLGPAPVPRIFPVGGTPLKIMYSECLNAIVAIVSKHGRPSLHFLDPSTGADISLPVMKEAKADKVDYIEGLGRRHTKISALSEWCCVTDRGGILKCLVILMNSQDRTRVLLVGADHGGSTTAKESLRKIRFWQSHDKKIGPGAPVALATNKDGIFVSIENTVYYLGLATKPDGGMALRVHRKHDLPSTVIKMQLVGDNLHVATVKHSVVVLNAKYFPLNNRAPLNIRSDMSRRNGIQSIVVDAYNGGGEQQHITLLSDPMCGIHGLGLPGPRSSTLRLKFRGEVGGSIRKFAQARTCPVWVENRTPYKLLECGTPESCILGLTIDGSVIQFSLLSEAEWRLLRYIQNLAVEHPGICPWCPARLTEDLSLDPSPKTNMHIDGDILARIVERRGSLEEMLGTGQHLDEAWYLLQQLQRPASTEMDSLAPSVDALYEVLLYYTSSAL